MLGAGRGVSRCLRTGSRSPDGIQRQWVGVQTPAPLWTPPQGQIGMDQSKDQIPTQEPDPNPRNEFSPGFLLTRRVTGYGCGGETVWVLVRHRCPPTARKPPSADHRVPAHHTQAPAQGPPPAGTIPPAGAGLTTMPHGISRPAHGTHSARGNTGGGPRCRARWWRCSGSRLRPPASRPGPPP